MTNPNENLSDRYPIASEPYDSGDVHRFGQLTEIAKDCFMSELKGFFTYEVSDGATKLTEIPNIEKFFITTSGQNPSLETTVNIIQSYGDVEDKFPMIALTSASVRQKPIGIGNNFVAHVQYAPVITGSNTGPFNVVDEETIELTTWPGGLEANAVTTTLQISSLFIADLTQSTITEIVKTFTAQALYVTPYATSDGKLAFKTGGPLAKPTPNYIEVTDGDTALLTALGFSIGDSDTYLNTDNPPKNKYGVAAEMVVNVDVVSDDINTRLELQDLVFDFFAYQMEKRRFQFLGRSYFDDSQDPEEWFHIILKNEFSWSAEYVKNRQDTEGFDKIYAVRGSVPIIIYDYIDKRITESPRFLDEVTFTPVTTFPDGDYGSS